MEAFLTPRAGFLLAEVVAVGLGEQHDEEHVSWEGPACHFDVSNSVPG